MRSTRKVASGKRYAKRRTKTAKKPLTLREVLDVVDRALAKGDDTSRDVWNVLTALRGPDLGDSAYTHKLQNTIPIRRAALPKTTTGINPADFGCSTDKFIEDDTVYAYGTGLRHFTRHAVRAAKTLGLIDAE